MNIIAVQLNHPGGEKPYRPGVGFFTHEGRIIRDWNYDNRHYRKLLKLQGEYLTGNNHEKKEGIVYFWGEWEPHSFFESLPKNVNYVHGIHTPILISEGFERYSCNTDPFVYGGNFYYSACKQRGIMTQLAPNSLILFGTSFKHGFRLDTVFVVEKSTPAYEVGRNKQLWPEFYWKVTLDKLGENYLNPDLNSPLKLYEGKTNLNYPDYFSYVPGLERIDPQSPWKGFILNYDNHHIGNNETIKFSKNPTGIKILTSGEESVRRLWNYLIKKVISEGGIAITKVAIPETVELKF